jgi:hypothetical protein
MARWARATVVAGLTLLGQACGKYEHDRHDDGPGLTTGNDSGGASGGTMTGGGTTTGGGAQASGGHGDAGSAVALEKGAASACVTYALAVCQRQIDCGVRSHDERCLDSAAAECPDLVFSPGSTRTAKGLLACAEAYATWPCDDVKGGVIPACVTPGARAQGEPCKYASQCESLQCETHGDCGQCSKTVDIGQSCSAPDVDCGSQGFCAASGTCQPMSGPLYLAGQPCTVDWPCQADYYCQDVCLPLPKVGESCLNTGTCAYGAYCGLTGACEAVPSAGQLCGLPRNGKPGEFFCEPGLDCDVDPSSMTGTCLPPGALGQACLFTANWPGNQACASGLHCDDTQGLCLGVAAAGGACKTIWDCEPDLICACPAGLPDCQQQYCAMPRVEGERCDEPNTACLPAFVCAAGKCKQGGLRSLFANACN